jgi:hypothetical protein
MANVQSSKPFYFVGQFGDGKAKGNLAYAQDGKGNSVKGLQFDDGNGNKLTALDLKGDSKFLDNPKMKDNLNKFLGDTGKKDDKKGGGPDEGKDGKEGLDKDKDPMGDLIGKLAEGLFGKDNPLTKALQGMGGGGAKDAEGGDGGPAALGGKDGGPPGGGSPFDFVKNIGGGGGSKDSGPPGGSRDDSPVLA